MTSKTDIRFMRMALNLARRGLGRTSPNPSVGCVIVKNGIVIGRGCTADGGRPHAEVIALSQAGSGAKGATAYVTLEPCNHHGETPPCSQALIKAGIKRAVIACEDPDPRTAGQGIETLKAAGIDVVSGVCEESARALNKGFILRVKEDRPLVTLKLAVSADGKIAAEEGKRTQITGERAQAYTHLLRSQHDAILIGANTQRVDNPQLTTRIDGYEHDSLRCVLSDGLDINGEKVDLDPRDLRAVLAELAKRGVTRLLVEGGAAIHTSFLEAGLCDQFYLFGAAHDIGTDGVEALKGHDIFKIAEEFDLEFTQAKSLSEDLLEIYKRKA